MFVELGTRARYAGVMSVEVVLEHRHLRRVLEYAVAAAAEAKRGRSSLAAPPVLTRYASMSRLPTSALGTIRRAVEGDEAFRSALAQSAAGSDLVDPIGRLWLERPEGWEDQIAQLVVELDHEAQRAQQSAAVRRERRRREAAEARAGRAEQELRQSKDRYAELAAELERVRASVVGLHDELSRLRADLATARAEARHALDRETAARRRVEQLEVERDQARQHRDAADAVRDSVLADRASSAVELGRLAAIADQAAALAAALHDLVTPGAPAGQADTDNTRRRRPRAIPGGLAGDSVAAAEFLLGSDATVLIDGYNVAMLRWPDLDLGDQRQALVDLAEAFTRRTGAEVTVVFDGADVAGAAADRRRLIRVVYSPAGVTADDVIRAEVERLPVERAVVVVTNDAEIIRDVRRCGANTVSSHRFLDVACR